MAAVAHRAVRRRGGVLRVARARAAAPGGDLRDARGEADARQAGDVALAARRAARGARARARAAEQAAPVAVTRAQRVGHAPQRPERGGERAGARAEAERVQAARRVPALRRGAARLREAAAPREHRAAERRGAPGGLAAMAGAIPGFDVDENVEAKETTCPICADVIAPGQTLCVLDCEHLFHPACIQDWVHSNPSCPMCRETVLDARAATRRTDEPEPESDAEGEGSERRTSRRSVRRRRWRALPGCAAGVRARRRLREHDARDGGARRPRGGSRARTPSSPDESRRAETRTTSGAKKARTATTSCSA